MNGTEKVPHTENVFVPLVDGAEPLDPGNNAGEVWSRTIDLTIAAPGCVRMAHGLLKSRDPKVLVISAEWTDISFLHDFENAPGYEPLMKDFNTMVGGPFLAFNVIFDCAAGTSTKSKFTSPVTDYVLGFFPTSEVERVAHARASTSVDACLASLKAKGCSPRSFATGWLIEEQLVVPREGKGDEKVWVALIGWDSQEHRDASQQAVLQEMAWIQKEGGELVIEQADLQQGPGF